MLNLCVARNIGNKSIAAAISMPEMKILDTIKKFRGERAAIIPNTTIGFVPTMGGLHGGHLKLVEQAKTECDFVVVSVFVNPIQFEPNDKFEDYPLSYESDMAKLKNAGVDIVFTPTPKEMFPNKQNKTFINVEGFNQSPEGQCRPEFFRGVATIVGKLFNIVNPTHGFFGQKDAAQCVLIRRMIDDLDFNIELRLVETCRESDGLAMATRNQYLNEEQRSVAGFVYRGLSEAEKLFQKLARNGDNVASDVLRNVVRSVYEKEPLMDEIQYISIASKLTMEELQQVEPAEGAILSVAVKLENCRLVDNIILQTVRK